MIIFLIILIISTSTTISDHFLFSTTSVNLNPDRNIQKKQLLIIYHKIWTDIRNNCMKTFNGYVPYYFYGNTL